MSRIHHKPTGQKKSPRPKEAPPAPAPLPKKLKISAELMARARTKRADGIEKLFPIEQIFSPYRPAPGVLPKGSENIAMDEAPSSILGWGQNGIASMVQEGMVFLGYPYLAELAQRPEYRRISEVIATEATREWIEFKGKGDEDKTDKIGQLEDDVKRLDVQGVVRQTLVNDGNFGRGHVYIDTGATDQPDELKTSLAGADGILSTKKIKQGSLKALRAIEPAWTYPVNYDSSDPLSDRWYNPDTWFVMGKEVHKTRLPTFIGRPVPDILKPAYSFGGLSLTQMAKPYVDNWLTTRQSVSDLIQAFSVMVLSTTMQTQLQGGSDAGLLDRADLFNLLRDNRGLFLLDKNSEDFKNVSAQLGTLDKLQAQALEHICSVTGIPLVKYTGIAPSGLNASSEEEVRVFYDWIRAYQETFRVMIQWIIDAIQISLWGKVDPDIVFVFKPLWALDDKQKAEVEKIKAETDGILIDLGVIGTNEARKRLASDPDSDYEGLDPDDLPDPPQEENPDDMNLGGEGEKHEEKAEPKEDKGDGGTAQV